MYMVLKLTSSICHRTREDNRSSPTVDMNLPAVIASLFKGLAALKRVNSCRVGDQIARDESHYGWKWQTRPRYDLGRRSLCVIAGSLWGRSHNTEYWLGGWDQAISHSNRSHNTEYWLGGWDQAISHSNRSHNTEYWLGGWAQAISHSNRSHNTLYCVGGWDKAISHSTAG